MTLHSPNLIDLTQCGRIEITRLFSDFDHQTITPGSYHGSIVRRGYCYEKNNWFWNILIDGAVLAVTVGYPPHTQIFRNEVQGDAA
jgi:hypothetical protein